MNRVVFGIFVPISLFLSSSSFFFVVVLMLVETA